MKKEDKETIYAKRDSSFDPGMFLKLFFGLFYLTALCLSSGGCIRESTKAIQDPPSVSAKWDDLKLWYNQPAKKWVEALPVGNGRLGAMVFGGTTFERIQLNEDTLWAGPPVPEDRVGAYEHIAKARKLIFDGKYSEGQAIMQRRVMGPRISPRSYQTLCDIRLKMACDDKAAGTIALTQWRRGGEDGPMNSEHTKVDFDDSKWQELLIKNGKFAKGSGAVPERRNVIFRSSFELTGEQLRAGLGTLSLGPIDDNSAIYVNGKQVRQTNNWFKPHSFDVAKYLRAGKNVLAVVVSNVGGFGGMTPSITLRSGPSSDASYKRQLDLDTAITTTTFKIDGITYKREIFASSVDQAVVVRLTADKPGSISVEVGLDRPTPKGQADFKVESFGSDTLTMSGQASQGGEHKGVKYHTALQAQSQGGLIEINDGKISIAKADALTLLLTAATDYNFDNPYEPLDRDLAYACARQLAAAWERHFERIRADHIAEHRRLFRRVHLDLGSTPAAEKPTDERRRRPGFGRSLFSVRQVFAGIVLSAGLYAE